MEACTSSRRPIQDFLEGRQPSVWGGGGRQHIIWPNFAENCMEMKKIGPVRHASKILLCRSAYAPDSMYHEKTVVVISAV